MEEKSERGGGGKGVFSRMRREGRYIWGGTTCSNGDCWSGNNSNINVSWLSHVML